jgi:ribosomal protein S18 acetylase RimI-like enzyme
MGPPDHGVPNMNPVHTDLRPAVPADIAEVLNLWRESAAPTSTDTAAALTGLLQRDAGALIVAGPAGAIVGSVIAGWDGWRGSIYRLAVAPTHRRRGIGRMLLHAAEERLVALGARRLHAIVVETDAHAVDFWQATAWEHQPQQRRYTWG